MQTAIRFDPMRLPPETEKLRQEGFDLFGIFCNISTTLIIVDGLLLEIHCSRNCGGFITSPGDLIFNLFKCFFCFRR